MKTITGWIVVTLWILTSLGSVNALEIQGSAGAGWQGWSSATEIGDTYFNQKSFDGDKLNVGYFMTKEGGWSTGTGPGATLDYWGTAGGSADSDFFFSAAGGQTAAFMAEFTFRDGAHAETPNQFGWFELDTSGSIGAMHMLFDSATADPSTTVSVGFTPTEYYGFYIQNAEGIFRTITGGLGFQHFSVFREDDLNYWIGVEDLVKLQTTTKRPYAVLTDKDYNDMIFKITAIPVPDAGATAALLGLGLLSVGILRKKIR